MKQRIAMAGALVGAILPAPGQASTATLRIFATIPVACSIDIIDTRVSEHTLTVLVHRECNAAHEITVSARPLASLGSVSMRLGAQERSAIGEYASLAEPEGYYERTEELLFTAAEGSADDLATFAATLSIGVESR